MNYDAVVNKKDPRAIFIAEAGINHDGDISKAKKMIDAAVEAVRARMPPSWSSWALWWWSISWSALVAICNNSVFTASIK